MQVIQNRSNPVAVWCKALICSLLSGGFTYSNPTEDMDVRLLFLLCVVHVVAPVTSWSSVQMSRAGFVCVCVCVCVYIYI